jgi:hypothetical protein
MCSRGVTPYLLVAFRGSMPLFTTMLLPRALCMKPIAIATLCLSVALFCLAQYLSFFHVFLIALLTCSSKHGSSDMQFTSYYSSPAEQALLSLQVCESELLVAREELAFL